MTRRRWRRWLGTVLLGLLLAAALGMLGLGTAHAQDDPPPFPPEDQPQPTQPAPQLPPPPSQTPLPDDPLEPIGPPEDPDLFDIPGQVSNAMHEFLAALVETGMRIVVALLSTTILATPDLTGNEQIRGLWTAMLVIANLTYVLFIVAGGFVVSARETLQTQYGFKEIVPRIVIAGLASNLSLLVVGQLIEFANAFTVGVSAQAIPAGAGAAIADTWDQAAQLTGVNILSLLLALVVVALALIVLVTYIVRVAVMVVLIVSAPVVLLFHALPQTEPLAFLWWRALAGCFVIQAGQTLTLIVTIGAFLFPFGSTVLGTPTSGHGWLALLVAITMLWLMIKIPVWVKEYLWLNSRGVFRRLLFAVFLFRTMTAAAAASRAGRGPGGGGRGTSSSPSSPSPRPGPTPRPGPRPRPRIPTRPSPTHRRVPAGTGPGRGTPPGGAGSQPVAPGPDGGSEPSTGAPSGPGGGEASGSPAVANPAAAGARAGTRTRPGDAPPAGRTATGGRAAETPTSRRTSAAAGRPARPPVTPPVRRPTTWPGSLEPPVRLRTSQATAPGMAPPHRPGSSQRSQPGSPAGDARRPRRPEAQAPVAGRQPANPPVTPVRRPATWRRSR